MEQFVNEMSNNGFSDVGNLKKLNFYFKTWDGVQVDDLASYNKEVFVDFLIANSGKMTQLEEVELWGFPSDRLNEFLSEIKSLKKINNTQGKYPFPKSIFLNKELEYLSLSLTPIKKIPKEIGELWNIRSLSFTQTDIQELPEEIGQLRELRNITIFSKLKKIHSTILSNINLTNIDFGSNKLTEFPEGFFELVNLESLDLSGNPIDTFNFQLANWPNLKRLDISRSPFGIYRDNIELMKNKFPNAEIIGGSGNLYIGDNKNGIYLSCTKLTYN
jgi:hypothetical protein